MTMSSSCFKGFYTGPLSLVVTLFPIFLHQVLMLTVFLACFLWNFASFLPWVIESYLGLLKDGADREPEIIEQVETLSCQKFIPIILVV